MLIVKTNIPESVQMDAFMNATLQSAGEELALSISITLPETANDFSEEMLLVHMLRQDFERLSDLGYTIEIQTGPRN